MTVEARRRLSTVLLALSCSMLGCAPTLQRQSAIVAAGNLDAKLASTTWIADGEQVALVVSTKATRFRLGLAYVPIEVAVVNRGLKSLSLTRESFSLVDGQGARYPLAGRKELGEGYHASVDVDRRKFSEAAPIVTGKYQSFSRVPSNFSPGFDNAIALDRVFLPRYSYLLDFLYFPTPGGYAPGAPLELQVTAPELENPIFVRFTVVGSP
jgi:hypothetical protein